MNTLTIRSKNYRLKFGLHWKKLKIKQRIRRDNFDWDPPSCASMFEMTKLVSGHVKK
jgi:hypothetical protein